jgi:hypothetical protein
MPIACADQLRFLLPAEQDRILHVLLKRTVTCVNACFVFRFCNKEPSAQVFAYLHDLSRTHCGLYDYAIDFPAPSPPSNAQSTSATSKYCDSALVETPDALGNIRRYLRRLNDTHGSDLVLDRCDGNVCDLIEHTEMSSSSLAKLTIASSDFKLLQLLSCSLAIPITTFAIKSDMFTFAEGIASKVSPDTIGRLAGQVCICDKDSYDFKTAPGVDTLCTMSPAAAGGASRGVGHDILILNPVALCRTKPRPCSPRAPSASFHLHLCLRDDRYFDYCGQHALLTEPDINWFKGTRVWQRGLLSDTELQLIKLSMLP